MALTFRKLARTAVIACIGVFPMGLSAESHVPSYTGLWHFHSSGGYTGYVTIDGMGGCSYFLSSAVLSVQATCIARELEDGGLVIFGTQEGTSSTAPVYGDQLANPTQPTQPRSTSTTVTFHVTDIQTDSMSGSLITPVAKERVQFTR